MSNEKRPHILIQTTGEPAQETKKRKFGMSDVSFITWMKASQLETYRKILNDPDKEARKERQLCLLCHYIPSVGGAMMTKSKCDICGKETLYGSTAVDRLCPDCAKEHKLCKHCGADLELRTGRRKF